MFPYPVINCQGLSNLLGLLAVRLNELETALIYLQQQNKNYSEVNGLSSSRSAELPLLVWSKIYTIKIENRQTPNTL